MLVASVKKKIFTILIEPVVKYRVYIIKNFYTFGFAFKPLKAITFLKSAIYIYYFLYIFCKITDNTMYKRPTSLLTAFGAIVLVLVLSLTMLMLQLAG